MGEALRDQLGGEVFANLVFFVNVLVSLLCVACYGLILRALVWLGTPLGWTGLGIWNSIRFIRGLKQVLPLEEG